jgi:molybdopterin synthase sulfur carrier subunit
MTSTWPVLWADPRAQRRAAAHLTHVGVEGSAASRSRAHVSGEVVVDGATQREVVDALEARYPALSGTIRDPATDKRRAFVRFFACQEDLSHDAPDAPLPDAVVCGDEPFLVVGAMAGG